MSHNMNYIVGYDVNYDIDHDMKYDMNHDIDYDMNYEIAVSVIPVGMIDNDFKLNTSLQCIIGQKKFDILIALCYINNSLLEELCKNMVIDGNNKLLNYIILMVCKQNFGMIKYVTFKNNYVVSYNLIDLWDQLIDILMKEAEINYYAMKYINIKSVKQMMTSVQQELFVYQCLVNNPHSIQYIDFNQYKYPNMERLYIRTLILDPSIIIHIPFDKISLSMCEIALELTQSLGDLKKIYKFIPIHYKQNDIINKKLIQKINFFRKLNSKL